MSTLENALYWLQKRAHIGFGGQDANVLLRAVVDLRERVAALEAKVKKMEAQEQPCEHVWAQDFVAKRLTSPDSCKKCGAPRPAGDE